MQDISKRVPVLVPYWIIKQLQRNCLPFNTVFDLRKMLMVANKEDLAIMLDLNNRPEQIFGYADMDQPMIMGLTRYWADYSYNEFKSIQEVLPLVEGRLEARLFASDAAEAVDCNTELCGAAFEIFPVDSGMDSGGALLLVIQPGYFGGETANLAQKQIAREYLKQSYVFSKFSTVAKDPIFGVYMRNLTEPTKVL